MLAYLSLPSSTFAQNLTFLYFVHNLTIEDNLNLLFTLKPAQEAEMTLFALVPNGAKAARPRCVNSYLPTKPFWQLQRPRIKCAYLKLQAIAALTLALLILAAVLPQPSLGGSSNWSLTDSLSTVRASHTATLLPNGKVLVAGGYAGLLGDPAPALQSAEVYHPAGGWSPAGNMGTARGGHTATLLPDGTVLVVGGNTGEVDLSVLATAELYLPGSGWIPTGSMETPRNRHTTTLLPNGKVLVTGGFSAPFSEAVASAELYDPASGTWSTIENMAVSRRDHTATLLPNGKVLVTGGAISCDAELYDPATGATGTWGPAGSMGTSRSTHTATLLLNGKVLVAGGHYPLESAELYDPAADNWIPTGPMGAVYERHTATLLYDGKVLVARGFSPPSAALYDPVSNTWTNTGDMVNPRFSHTATRLPNGQVLAAGGYFSLGAPWDSAELYEPKVFTKTLPKALLAFYRFEGDPADASGNGRHGTITGNPLVVPGFLHGWAYSFNGSTDYITAPLNINPDQYPRLTMGCWAKKASLWPLQQLLTHDDGSFDRAIGIDFRGNGIGWSAFCGPVGQVLGASPAILGQWTFVAAVYDQVAKTVRFQVDDMVFTKEDVFMGAGQDRLFIGASPAFSVFFSGAIDNVFVFGDALTDQQLTYIRSGGAQAIMTAARKIDPGILFLLLD